MQLLWSDPTPRSSPIPSPTPSSASSPVMLGVIYASTSQSASRAKVCIHPRKDGRKIERIAHSRSESLFAQLAIHIVQLQVICCLYLRDRGHDLRSDGLRSVCLCCVREGGSMLRRELDLKYRSAKAPTREGQDTHCLARNNAHQQVSRLPPSQPLDPQPIGCAICQS